MELRMQYATTRDGVRIAFGTAGKGSPLIVRVASLPFVHSQLEWSQGSEFFDQLAENWTVVQYDPRGTGLSDRDVHEFSMQKRLLDLEAVAGKLGLERFVLHGIRWGPTRRRERALAGNQYADSGAFALRGIEAVLGGGPGHGRKNPRRPAGNAGRVADGRPREADRRDRRSAGDGN